MSPELTLDAALPRSARGADRSLLLETLLLGAVGLAALVGLAFWAGRDAAPAWAEVVESGGDHISTAHAAELIASDGAVLIDVRPADEFAQWHLPGAVNLDLPQLLGPRGARVLEQAGKKPVVLMSNGMTHPAQAWVELTRRGWRNVRVLDGGLTDFKREVLTPPSLRGPVSQASAAGEAARFQAMQSWLESRR